MRIERTTDTDGVPYYRFGVKRDLDTGEWTPATQQEKAVIFGYLLVLATGLCLVFSLM